MPHVALLVDSDVPYRVDFYATCMLDLLILARFALLVESLMESFRK